VLRISSDGVSTFLPASGPPLGILEGADWSDETSVVRPGETLLLFTDGIVEARDGRAEPDTIRDDDEYGIEGLIKIARARNQDPPRRLIEAILADVDAHCSPLAPHDDCTMIALKYNGHD
jgi:sigma-B regulation protein RsbU (phosphoserine phosphatase)